MADDAYFVVTSSEDGGANVQGMSKEVLEKRLSEDYWGKREVLDNMPDSWDYGNIMLVIKGQIVVPKPVEVVKKWIV